MLLDELDGTDRIRFRRPHKLTQAARQRIRAAEWIRRAHDPEQVETLVKLFERVRDPLDVRRGRRRVLRGTKERNFRAVPARDLGDLLAVGGTEHALEDP